MSDQITDDQIRALATKSNAENDDETFVLATIALELEAGECLTPAAFEERFGGGGISIGSRAYKRILSLTAAEAWDECARIILGHPVRT